MYLQNLKKSIEQIFSRGMTFRYVSWCQVIENSNADAIKGDLPLNFSISFQCVCSSSYTIEFNRIEEDADLTKYNLDYIDNL